MTRDGDDDGLGQGPVEFLPVRSGRGRPPVLAEIEGHWRELKARSPHLPRRADLDASRIAGALPHAFVAERLAPGIARIRIAGRALSDFLGTEARGLPLSVFFTPLAREGLRRWLERCFEAPAVVELPLEARQGPFRPVLTGRLLLLPMLDGDGGVTRALGGLLVEGTKRATIVKFDLVGAPLRCEILTPATYAMLPAVPIRGMSESERPYLRLVVDNSQRAP